VLGRASFFIHLQRTEWLAYDVDGYVAQALRRQMQASGLCQIERHTREMEAIYRQALEGAAS
jgi:predicted O-linked N-acetylglucosamine transferase (SPINDLY family)